MGHLIRRESPEVNIGGDIRAKCQTDGLIQCRPSWQGLEPPNSEPPQPFPPESNLGLDLSRIGRRDYTGHVERKLCNGDSRIFVMAFSANGGIHTYIYSRILVGNFINKTGGTRCKVLH